LSNTSTEEEVEKEQCNGDGSANDKVSEPVRINNDNSTVKDFDFVVDRSSKAIKPTGTYRTYYKCKEARNNKIKCPAKYTSTTKPTGDKSANYFQYHNHPQPTRTQTPKEVKDNLVSRMKDGAPPGMVHRNLINNSKHPEKEPTRKQLDNWKYRDAAKDMPSRNIPHHLLFFIIILLIM
jgi:hypothetical protein